jgi:hypothetical protein
VPLRCACIAPQPFGYAPLGSAPLAYARDRRDRQDTPLAKRSRQHAQQLQMAWNLPNMTSLH